MTVSYLTLYLAGQQVQVVEGSQLHLIYAAMGGTAQPPVPGPPTRPDPFPQYVHDDELVQAVAAATDPAVAALVGTPGTATRSELDNRYVSAAVDGTGGVTFYLDGVEL